MPVGADEYRATLSRWASGVSVVTTQHDGRRAGMTLSAFNSVSLQPPLILICATHDSVTCQLIQQSGVFAVNVLAEGQSELSQRFADARLEGERFDGLELLTGRSGLPLLDATAASLECRVTNSHSEGDHRVFIGEVLFSHVSERAPLLFLQHRYGRFVAS